MSKSNYAAALAVIDGVYGNGAERRAKLHDAGYNPDEVQSIVNALIRDGYTAPRILTVNVNLSQYDGMTLIFDNEGGREDDG